MENKKYEFTGETMKWEARTLHRVRALRDFGDVKKGELGGWIESEENLSHDGICWVFDNAKVFDEARVYDNAEVCDNAVVYIWAEVCDNAIVRGNAEVCDNATISGYARIHDIARVSGDAKVYGSADVSGYARVSDDAIISNTNDIFLAGPIGSRGGYTTFYRITSGEIMVCCGCFNDAIEKFEKKVQEVHKGTKYEKEYKTAIELAKTHINLKGE